MQNVHGTLNYKQNYWFLIYVTQNFICTIKLHLHLVRRRATFCSVLLACQIAENTIAHSGVRQTNKPSAEESCLCECVCGTAQVQVIAVRRDACVYLQTPSGDTVCQI